MFVAACSQYCTECATFMDCTGCGGGCGERNSVISASQTEDAAIARDSLYAILTLALLAVYSIVTIALIMKEQK